MLAVKASPFAVTVPSDTGNDPEVRLFLGFACRWQNRACYVRSMPYDAEFGYQPSRCRRTEETPPENFDPIGRSQDFLES
jgi:hypothetical protein